MTTETPEIAQADPGVLEILGAVAEAFGLAEHVQRILPLHRMRAERRHAQIDKRFDAFVRQLEDARVAIRVLSSVVGEPASALRPGTIAFAIPVAELPVLRRGLEQLQSAVQGMTDAAYELETLTTVAPEDTERFYRVSSGGRPVLRAIAAAVAHVAEEETRVGIADRPVDLPMVLAEVDRYLAHVSTILSERDKWLRG
jgi:hypothetical protein